MNAHIESAESADVVAGIRALSVARPWAGLIVAGHKPIENRSWSTRYRGLLVIHASKRWDPYGAAFADEVGMSTRPLDHPTGYLGCVEMTGLHHAVVDGPAHRLQPAGPMCWHWQLTHPTAFPTPIAGPGRLGLFVPPAEVLLALVTAPEVTR